MRSNTPQADKGSSNSFPLFPLFVISGIGVLTVRSCNERKVESEKLEATKNSKFENLTLSKSGPQKTLLPSEVIEWTKAGKVESLTNFHAIGTSPDSYTIDISLKDGTNAVAIFNQAQFQNLHKQAQASNIKLKTSVVQPPAAEQFITINSNKPLYEPFIMPGVILAGFYMMYRLFKGIGSNLSKSLSSLGESSELGLEEFKPTVKFDDVGGSKVTLAKLRPVAESIIEYVKTSGKSESPAKAVLLYGPPGTGKSFIGSAVAGEAQCPVISTSASELTSEPFIGSWGKKIHTLFDKARKLRDKNGACVIIIDEAELLAMSRGIKGTSSNAEQQRAVTALLTELDGPKSIQNKGITVIYTTNYKDRMDDALLRPGRCPIQIEVGLPNSIDDRIDIFKKLFKSMDSNGKLSLTEDMLELMGKLSDGLTPDQMKSLTTSIIKNSNNQIQEDLIIESIQDLLLGSKSGVIATLPKKTLVAAHELGHALLGGLVQADCYAISMIPRGESLGHVLVDNSTLLEQPCTRDDILKAMLIKAGGRAGEIAYGEGKYQALSTGVSSDFDGLYHLASIFVSSGMDDGHWGMSTLGMEQKEMPTDVRLKVEQIASSAIMCASDILHKMNGEFKKAIDDVIGLDKELTGKEASEYIIKILGPIRDELTKTIDKFLSDPIQYTENRDNN